MAIARRPKRNQLPSEASDSEKRAEAFIAGAGKQASEAEAPGKKTVLLRIDPELIERFDRTAKRLGISRAGFIVSSAVKELERLS